MSRELGKVSLKTIPCLRVPPGVVALGKAPPAPVRVGMDLGGEPGGDIEPRPRGMGPPGRIEPVFLPRYDENEPFWLMSVLPLLVVLSWSFSAVAAAATWFGACDCAARSPESGVTARMVVWGLGRDMGLLMAERCGVLLLLVVRRLPADVLRGMDSARRAAPAPAPVAVAVAVAMAAAAAEAEVAADGEAEAEAKAGDLMSASGGRWVATKVGSKVCRRGTDGREADGRRGRGGGREAS